MKSKEPTIYVPRVIDKTKPGAAVAIIGYKKK
jgi:hypothetical protein